MNKNKSLLLILIVFLTSCVTQQPVNVVPVDYDISDNLDLEAVASIFGQSANLEDFERRLNNPEARISNLDLNEDGYVDYLRIVEIVERGSHIITIQAALGNDIFQDVATIDVERDNYNKTYIQFIGHPYFYGPQYIIEPVYYHTPIIINNFWGPSYIAYHSPYYWNYYPSYYTRWRPLPVTRYITHIHIIKEERNTYKYVPERRNKNASTIIRDTRKNDYVRQKPEQTFDSRNKDARNKHELETRRNSTNSRTQSTSGTTVPRNRTGNDNVRETDTKTGTRTNTSPSERTPSKSSRTSPSTTSPSTRKPSTSPKTRETESTSKTTRKNTRSERN
ncbi:MAG: hypothetical protein NXI00_04480 [Cytophagales bacterium]|nr:hypothetical protein [Cytophagales bacterium]